jgi:hypothetical protein
LGIFVFTYLLHVLNKFINSVLTLFSLSLNIET